MLRPHTRRHAPWTIAACVVVPLLAGLSVSLLRRPAAPPATQTTSREEFDNLLPAVDVRLQQRALNRVEAQDYVGDAACAPCHPDAARAQAQTRHAHTLRAIDPKRDASLFAGGNVVRDPVRKLAYHTSAAGGRYTLEVAGGKEPLKERADWVLGTGENAYTYLAANDPDRFTELRLTHYRTGQWDFSPQEFPKDSVSGPTGQEQRGAKLNGCLLCHVTTLQRDEHGVRLDTSILGVGCERCHGPGRRHIQLVQRRQADPAMKVYRQADAATLTELCSQCHRDSNNASLENPHMRANLPRFQGLALELSQCYKRSRVLSCITCHKPHENAQTSLAYYDKICLSCHQPKQEVKLCPVNTRSGCAECHMPKQRIAGIPTAEYRNHWIKVWKK